MDLVDAFLEEIYEECIEEEKQKQHHIKTIASPWFVDSPAPGASPGGLNGQPAAATYSVGNAGPLTGTGMEEIPHLGSGGEINVGALTPTAPVAVQDISFDLRSASSSRPPLSPSRIPCSQWEKGPCIGRGSFGQVFIGSSREHGQLCAIKQVQVILDDPHSEEQLTKLNQEIDILKQLSHRNIVKYYGSIMTDSTFSIYMEYVSMGSIHKLLGKHGRFEESKIRIYTAQIVSGLAFMHERKHIHRDIKGANILVGPNDEVKIADFGLAKHIQTKTAVHTSRIGTVWWMAPENILSNYSGKGYNLSADIWSLGCTVIEMATGKPPLRDLSEVQAMFKIMEEKYKPEIPDNLSDEGKDFLRLCLERHPNRRHTAAQLLDHPFTRNQG